MNTSPNQSSDYFNTNISIDYTNSERPQNSKLDSLVFSKNSGQSKKTSKNKEKETRRENVNDSNQDSEDDNSFSDVRNSAVSDNAKKYYKKSFNSQSLNSNEGSTLMDKMMGLSIKTTSTSTANTLVASNAANNAWVN
jgi:hypothetical protein